MQAAIESGMQILGFSDHVPYPFSNGHRSGFRMEPEEHRVYVEEIQALREKYEGQIQIYIGYEAEYYPKEFSEMLENLLRYPCDYLILGQHFTHNEYDGIYTNGKNAGAEGVLVHYVNQVIEGMETGLFSCVAHPDILRYRMNGEIYAREMRRLCKAAVQMEIPLELNFLGLGEKRDYPYEPFWKIAGEMHVPVIFGCDAHLPKALGDEATLRKARKWAEACNLQVVPTMKLRPVRKDFG